MTRRTGRIALLGAALVLVAQGAATAADPLRITSPVNITSDDLNPNRLYLAPGMAIDPNNQMTVAANVTEMRTKNCSLAVSTNGGQTWRRPDTLPAPPSDPFCLTYNRGAFQGQLAFGRSGTLYYALPGWDTPDVGARGNANILVARTDDLGESWQTVVARENRGKTGEAQEAPRPIGSIAIDRKTGKQDVVYVGYTTRFNGFTGSNSAPSTTTVLVSRDGGRTFDEPVFLPATIFEDASVRARALAAGDPPQIPANAPPDSRAAKPDQAANFGGFQPVLSVGPDGTVYAVWPSTTANINPRPPAGIFLSKSTDQGRTWTTTQILDFSDKHGTFVQLAGSDDGGRLGTLHVVMEYRDQPKIAGLSDIYYLRSTDGGATWSEPRNITDDDRSGLYGQYFPNIAVAPNGRIDVAFYDTRNDPGYRANDVYFTYSNDNGLTWSANQRVSDRSIDRRIGVWSLNYDMNTPPSLASADKFALLGWDETRNTDLTAPDALEVGGGLQDMFVAAVQFEAIGGGTSAVAKAVLAGVLGLMAVGLVLLAFAGASRRASGTPAPAGESVRDPAQVT